jgi:DNA-directed RNA polymerase subunit RPC12/RpoP
MGYPKDYPLELDTAEHYVFESEELEEQDIIPIGTTVRSYDFVVGNHILNDDSYFEGIIERFEPIPNCAPDCNHYIIRTTKIVRNGKEEEIMVGRNDYFSTHWNNYGVLPLGNKKSSAKNAESEDTSGVRCNRCRQGFLQDIPRYERVNNKPVECDNCSARFEVVSQGTTSKLKTTSRRNKYFHAETFDAERGCSYPCPDCGTQMFQHDSNTGFGSYCSCWKCGSNYITKPMDAEMEGRDYQ